LRGHLRSQVQLGNEGNFAVELQETSPSLLFRISLGNIRTIAFM
jgi:hypothetical protein